MGLSEASSSTGLDIVEAAYTYGGLGISEEFSDDEAVENLPADLLEVIDARKGLWTRWYSRGLCLHDANVDSFEILSARILYATPSHWPSLFEAGEQRSASQEEIVKWVVQTVEVGGNSIEVKERAPEFLPGLPDEIVEHFIWPRLQTQFRGLAKYSLAEKGEIVDTFRALRCVSRRWNHLVSFSYEWAVYRMVQWDVIHGWVWWSHQPSLVNPFTEIARMVDLLPEPTEEATPYLHHKMGYVKSEDLWIWRTYLNYGRYLRYNTGHNDLHCGLGGDPRNTGDFAEHYYHAIPCDDCFYYPRLCDPGDLMLSDSETD